MSLDKLALDAAILDNQRLEKNLLRDRIGEVAVYDPHSTLMHLDAHKWAIMGLCSFAMIFNYIWFFAALRQARIDRRYSVPVATTLFWLVGDGTFVLKFRTWFHTYHDWYPELFWVALLFTVAFEIAFTVQIVRYGKDELLPRGSQQQLVGLIAAGVALAATAWWLVSHFFIDPLGIAYFDVANLSGPIAAIGLLVRRGNRAGQTPLIWYSYAAMASVWSVAQYLWFGPEFRAGAVTGASIVCVATALAVGYAVSRMATYSPAGASLAPKARLKTLA